jgi:hypothetical protein
MCLFNGRCSSYNTVMCDILKPHDQVAALEAPSSSTQLVSAGAEATASVAAIMDTHPFAGPSDSAGRDGVPGHL